MIVVRFTPRDARTRAAPTRGGRGGRLARALDLHEYQGKELFRQYGIPVSDGRLATTPARRGLRPRSSAARSSSRRRC